MDRPEDEQGGAGLSPNPEDTLLDDDELYASTSPVSSSSSTSSPVLPSAAVAAAVTRYPHTPKNFTLRMFGMSLISDLFCDVSNSSGHFQEKLKQTWDQLCCEIVSEMESQHPDHLEADTLSPTSFSTVNSRPQAK
ncbi:hypothetical protein UPYG_G00259510 [Umbra pygmaea]|uniref:Uncharacterized protein n=1 Tax=Umbra pygmaea TaxID=75934 RepID=A0ABD0W8U9_UMBPY